MDSLSQYALGAAVGVAVMGRRTKVWKAALWGGICGTIPDLDAFIDHGDPIRNMTFHRAESHSLLYLTLLSPAIAWIASRVHREAHLFRRWWLALWLALFTHPWLDWMTIYGTQLFIPFTNHPAALGSLFIIDPLYTLPLLIGLIGTSIARGPQRLRWNGIGLTVSCMYALWSAGAQAYVHQIAQRELEAQRIETTQVLTTATAFNTVLWRIVAMTPDGGYVEGFRSLAEGWRAPMRFDRFESNRPLYETLQDNWGARRMAWFSRGYFAMSEREGIATITDLRMGQEPGYAFAFRVARRSEAGTWLSMPYEAAGSRGDIGRGLAWIWARTWDASVTPLWSMP